MRPFALAVLCLLAPLSSARSADWAVWRGPTGDGVSTETEFPLRWSATENVTWKTPCPPGHASPVVFGDKVFTAGYDAQTDTFRKWFRATPFGAQNTSE